MPAPLLPLLAGAISRLVTANVGRSVTGAIARVTARGAAASAKAAPGNAKSALGSVFQTIRQKAARSAKRARLQLIKRTPGIAQRRQWGRVQQAFGQINKARALRLRGIMRSDPAMIDRANEQEAAAKQRLAKETKALLESFTGLRRSLVRMVIAIHAIPFAIQAIGRARVDMFRANGMFSGRTASSLARYDINERLNRISSARYSSRSDTRVINATQSLNNELKPLTDAMHVLYNEGLVVLIRATTGLVSMMRTFSPLVSAVERLANKLAGGPAIDDDATVNLFRGIIAKTEAQQKLAKQDWDKFKAPLQPGGKL